MYKKKQNIILVINSMIFNSDILIENEIANKNYTNICKLSFNKLLYTNSEIYSFIFNLPNLIL